MKIYKAVCLAAAVVFCSSPAFAEYWSGRQEEESSAVSGMETRKVSEGVSVLLPQGARMHRSNASTFVEESSDEYAARNFARIDERIKRLEEAYRALAEEVAYLKSKFTRPERDKDRDAPKIPGR